MPEPFRFGSRELAAQRRDAHPPNVVPDACVPAVTDLQEPRGAATAVRPKGRADFSKGIKCP